MTDPNLAGVTDGRAGAREILADVEHTRWAGWQRYLHDQCGYDHNDGTLTIPAELVERWERQIATPYADLSEQEKESDRAEVDKSLDALRAAGYVIVEGDVIRQLENAVWYAYNDWISPDDVNLRDDWYRAGCQAQETLHAAGIERIRIGDNT